MIYGSQNGPMLPPGPSTGKLYPIKVRKTLSLKLPNRKMKTMSHRLRLGCVCLYATLHKIGCHDNGLCDDCQVPETIEHHLLQCTGAVSKTVKDTSEKLGIQPSVATALGNVAILAAIFEATADRRL